MREIDTINQKRRIGEEKVGVTFYSIIDVAEKVAIAVKFENDENYYIYRNLNYIPENFTEMIKDLNLKENAVLNNVVYHEWYGEGEVDYNYIAFEEVKI